MRIKTIRKKGKMAPKEKGKPLSHKKLGQANAKSVRSIRGIYEGWKKAPKFILRVQSSPYIRLYLGKTSNDKGVNITLDRKHAMEFAHGYDNLSIKCEYWARQAGLTFKSENI